jgi:hypothetical protein
MPVSATNTYTGVGKAEDFEDIIYDISPTETPLLTMAKRLKSTATLHQWQTDVLDPSGVNRQLEGDDASFATHAATTTLSNNQQISRKTVQISGTYDAIKKYGRKSEVAYQLMKAGKALKLDIEFALMRNQISTAGGAGTARSSAGMEAWISGNRVLATGSTAGTTPAVTTTPGTAITDGTSVTFIEADLKTALQLAWVDGGDPSVIMMSATNKNRFDAFAGVATKFSEVKSSSQATITGASDIYVSSFGNHVVKLNRNSRDQAVLCIDPEYVGVSFLRGIQKEQLAKIGDSERWQILAEYGLVVNNMDAHSKVQNTGA